MTHFADWRAETDRRLKAGEAMLAALEKLEARRYFNSPGHAVHGCTFYMSADEYKGICAALAEAKAAGIKVTR